MNTNPLTIPFQVSTSADAYKYLVENPTMKCVPSPTGAWRWADAYAVSGGNLFYKDEVVLAHIPTGKQPAYYWGYRFLAGEHPVTVTWPQEAAA